MELDNKVCVITGGASGIGAATSRAFAAKGARVVVTDINMEGARQVAEEIGGHAITCDVSVEAEVNNLVAETEEQLGPIDLFFNNAAVATGGNPLNTPIDVWQDQWNINVMAHVYAVRAVLPGMLARGQGYLLHTASMAGILTSQGNLTYATTKHAVVGLAEWLSITYHDQGIRVSLLAPLGVRTPMLGDLSSPFAVSAAGP
ncbi:MAG: SDR family oxidoreductase, partial [Gammaproteobacteria bacterium]|nr:SDR family oxidoreductase [Gammaproteobacteria bacterium]MBT6586924.1 SDR family oxidoreductase [Gammaproteobacteria bacterium]